MPEPGRRPRTLEITQGETAGRTMHEIDLRCRFRCSAGAPGEMRSRRLEADAELVATSGSERPDTSRFTSRASAGVSRTAPSRPAGRAEVGVGIDDDQHRHRLPWREVDAVRPSGVTITV